MDSLNSPVEIEKMPSPYPSHLIFRDEFHAFIHKSLKREKTVQTPFTADDATLQSLEIDTAFESLITNSRSDALTLEGKTYPDPIYEFISSFTGVREGDRIVKWRFRIGNEEFVYNKWQLGVLFGFPTTTGIIPSFGNDELLGFWKEITGMDVHEPDMSPKCIGVGVWKYLHRLIAMSINTRCDNGSTVTIADLELMLAMKEKIHIDYTHILGTRFEDWQNLSSPNSALGGAIFIHKIVENEKFTVDHLDPTFKLLNGTNMLLTRMIHTKGGIWVHSPRMGKKTIAKEKRLEKKRKGKQVIGEGSSRGMRSRCLPVSDTPAGVANSDMERLVRIELKLDQMGAQLTKLGEDAEVRWDWMKMALGGDTSP